MYDYNRPLVLERVKTPEIPPDQHGVTTSDPQAPVCGVKNSGYGREFSHFEADAFVNAQTVWIANL
jgi:acyl-CoA reductase-like NAD-dependent aldehyde dehydrogenase